MIAINDLLRMSVENKCSDIHLSVGVPPKFRINGTMQCVGTEVITPETAKDLILPTMNARHKEILQDKGEVDYSYAMDEDNRFRVNTFSQKGTLACVFRRISSVIPQPEQLGLPENVVELYKKKRGLVLVTGPTGSGKSTTLASLIDKVNCNRYDHVVTMEDPIEYLHRHKKSTINQREIGQDTLSYANALKAVLREDPDVILVGEMRDLETISTAVTAAETGHLVFSTLHTIGAAATIDRVIDVFPPHQQQQIRIQLAMVLEAVSSQQLLPTADGRGRVAAFEIMHSNPAIRALVREGKTHQIMSTIQTNRALGMITMDDSLAELYQRGTITRDVALEFAQDVTYLRKKL